MIESHLISRNLPVEILQHIFQKGKKNDLCNYALVCKTWLYPAQTTLFSHVNIHTLSQLQKLHKAFESNAHLGILVKFFSIFVKSEMTRVEVSNLYSSLLCNYLPKLELLCAYPLRTYIPVLDALTVSQLSRVKNLDEPTQGYESGEVAHYVTCALLMKDRLGSLTISDNYLFDDGKSCEHIFFDHLYNKLHQFDNLTSIKIERRTNDEIQVLEHIVEGCKSLKEIKYSFQPSKNVTSVNSCFSNSAISDFVPRHNIKKLFNMSYWRISEKTLVYIMHKFPGLLSFQSAAEADASLPKLMSHQTVTQLLEYLPSIKEYQVWGLKINQESIGKGFQSHWISKSCFGSEDISITYTDASHAQTWDVSNTDSQRLYFSSNQGWKTFDFIERNGKYLKELYFAMDEEDDALMEVPQNFMNHTITHCPYLRLLSIFYFHLTQQFTHSRVEHNNEFSLDELFLNRCSWSPGVLEQWSQIIPEVKRLSLYRCKQIVGEDGNTTKIKEINMKYTKVDSIVIKNDSKPSPYYLKLVVVGENNSHYYYQNNSEDLRKMDLSNEQKFEDVNDHRHRINICCLTKPHIVIK